MNRLICVVLISMSVQVSANTKPWFSDFIKPGSIVIVKSERKLYLFDKSGEVVNYPVAIGKSTTPSPTGEYVVERKAKNPSWYPSEAIRYENPNKILPEIVPPGPANPLGPRAIYLSEHTLRIHGTTNPKSIGKAVSHGCFRMYNQDVVKLYELVEVGMPVYVFK